MSEILLAGFLLIVLFVLLGTGVWVAFSLMAVGMVGMFAFTEAPIGQIMATTWSSGNISTNAGTFYHGAMFNLVWTPDGGLSGLGGLGLLPPL